MAGRSAITYSRLFILLQALWVLPAVEPASAQVSSPSRFHRRRRPARRTLRAERRHPRSRDLRLAPFIALNWVALDPAKTGTRARPNVNVDFLSIKADKSSNFPLLVWQTYRHKNELFPAGGQTAPSFDSSAPAYKDDSQPMAASYATYDLFNNLDESSKIGLCNMFAHTNVRIAYEAKVNRTEFDYANKNGFTNCSGPNCPTLAAASFKTSNSLAQYGGICSTDLSIVSLPCGDAAVDGDAGEGAIEIKAAWRMLTDAEMASGRFYTRKVIYYKGGQDTQSGGSQQYYNAGVQAMPMNGPPPSGAPFGHEQLLLSCQYRCRNQ
jgi:hypothetical protein